ncbi:hypothetical protein FAZ69_24905 [Trinickia terrae]|uniref:Carboxypeptidase regulatory-like domain-containing protein n=1 Tax=Trinickia terrae TaxID=2571161 RepID=A0A4U1HVI6_9BURK|nr:hypothetical protein [Trinickia terrae]TKC82946.1 hypothetical protein FAZ69_24905 [Trinickia terrae]
MKHKTNTGILAKTRLALAIGGVLALSIVAGCGGGGSSSGSTATSSGTSTATATQLTGTVAVGNAIANANVTVIDVNGNTATTTSNSSGTYTVSLAGLTAPFVVVAADPTGNNATLYSVVSQVPTGTSSPVVANVTTLTSAVAALLTTSGNPVDLASSSSLQSLVTPATVTAAVTKLDSALASILSANGLNATFDPIGTAFTANQTGADAVIDAVQIVPGPSGGTQLVSTASPSSGITLSQSTTVSGPLSAPPATANYLATLFSQLSQCLAASSSSCSAIDASYLDNGFATFATAHPSLAASGVTLGMPHTIEFFTGTNGKQQALVALPYTTSSGSGEEVTVAQDTGNGTWDIIGNQEQYNVTITSYVSRRQYLDSADASFGRYEAGLGITIPVGAAGTPNPAALAAASVTGPGISGTLYLVPRSASGSSTLSLTSQALTSVPTGGVTSSANTSLYRWSWTALPGATSTFRPGTNNRGFYAAQPIDVSSVPQFTTYTVTFYDTSGNQLGTTSVRNITPTMSSSAGANVAWQTLSSSTQNDVLNPSGSLAGTQSTINLSWSNLVNGRNIAPPVAKAQIQSAPGTGVTPSTEIDGWWVGPATFAAGGQYTETVTAGVASNNVQQCSPACQFPALQTGGGRLAELYFPIGKVAYYNDWKYND